jgi:hypothetical protein
VAVVPTLAVTEAARRYALGELSRRAGVGRDWSDRFRVRASPGETTVELDGAEGPKVVFEHASERGSPGFLRHAGRPRTVRATWPGRPRRGASNADFLVPFSPASARSGCPLFEREGKTVRFKADVLAATVMMLARAEELVPGARDDWGRFPASESALGREGALERPIVDEYGGALAQALEELVPVFTPEPRSLRFHLSHDVDEVGLPFRLRQSLGHTVRRSSVTATLRDLVASVSPARPALLFALGELVRAALDRGVRTALYFKASERTAFDSGYRLAHPKVSALLEWLKVAGVELGVHPSHFTLGSPNLLAKEVATLQSVLGERAVGGRQHHLRWRPETWLDWENSGLFYDSSVGFADHVGFRAGTALPYKPWLLWLDREAALLEVPLIAMDTTLFRYQRLSENEVRDTLSRLLAACRSVGGVFTLLWHNTSFVAPSDVELYREVLEVLAPLEPFEPRGATP